MKSFPKNRGDMCNTTAKEYCDIPWMFPGQPGLVYSFYFRIFGCKGSSKQDTSNKSTANVGLLFIGAEDRSSELLW